MNLSIRPIVYTALFAALYVALSAVTIPMSFSSVPFTLQNLAVMLAGTLLGARYGFLSIGIVIALTAAGLPLLHGQGGIGYLLGPTGGFIISFPFCALIVGFFTRKLLDAGLPKRNKRLYIVLLFLAVYVFGSLGSYVIGVPWLAVAADIPLLTAFVAYCLPYLAGDALKAVIAVIVTAAVLPYMPVLQAAGSNARRGVQS